VGAAAATGAGPASGAGLAVGASGTAGGGVVGDCPKIIEVKPVAARSEAEMIFMFIVQIETPRNSRGVAIFSRDQRCRRSTFRPVLSTPGLFTKPRMKVPFAALHNRCHKRAAAQRLRELVIRTHPTAMSPATSGQLLTSGAPAQTPSRRAAEISRSAVIPAYESSRRKPRRTQRSASPW
jgi:hypothetical protein